MQFIGVLRLRPGLFAHARNRLGIKLAELLGFRRVEPAPAHDSLGAALFKRRVVEEAIGPRIQDFECQRRGMRQVACHELFIAVLQCRQQLDQPFDVHGLMQAVAECLVHQWMVRYLALADNVLGAGNLVGEHHRDQILGLDALERRRVLVSAAEALHRE